MSVDSYAVSSNFNDSGAPGVLLSVSLSGGLGRITMNDVPTFYADTSLHLYCTGQFKMLSEEQASDMRRMFTRWEEGNIPLRALVFTEKVVLVEDSEEFVIIPHGERKITVG